MMANLSVNLILNADNIRLWERENHPGICVVSLELNVTKNDPAEVLLDKLYKASFMY